MNEKEKKSLGAFRGHWLLVYFPMVGNKEANYTSHRTCSFCKRYRCFFSSMYYFELNRFLEVRYCFAHICDFQ